jgi:hypothetical protein
MSRVPLPPPRPLLQPLRDVGHLEHLLPLLVPRLLADVPASTS